jgi:hypothetical protein
MRFKGKPENCIHAAVKPTSLEPQKSAKAISVRNGVARSAEFYSDRFTRVEAPKPPFHKVKLKLKLGY